MLRHAWLVALVMLISATASAQTTDATETFMGDDTTALPHTDAVVTTFRYVTNHGLDKTLVIARTEHALLRGRAWRRGEKRQLEGWTAGVRTPHEYDIQTPTVAPRAAHGETGDATASPVRSLKY